MNRDKIVALATNDQAKEYIDKLRNIFRNAPHLPSGITEFLVEVAPWLTIIAAVLGAFSSVQNLMYAFGIRHYVMMPVDDFYWLITGIGGLLGAYLMFLAFPLLKERAFGGWALMFWNSILSILISTLSVFYWTGSLVGVVLGAIISFYLAFELYPYYTGEVAAASETASESKSKTQSAKQTKKTQSKTKKKTAKKSSTK